MAAEPTVKRTVAFFDGQNLFHAAREAFGIRHPDFDPVTLAKAVRAPRGWALQQVRFYTGVPGAGDNPFWDHFWADEIREIARAQKRWFKMASAFPASPTVRNRRGVNGSDWIPVDRQTYEACRDPRDYRPKEP
ncbi:MAG: hypothetical protein ABR538_07125 [Candidatus Binatia bacterium]